jgi:hypothetical protein
MVAWSGALWYDAMHCMWIRNLKIRCGFWVFAMAACVVWSDSACAWSSLEAQVGLKNETYLSRDQGNATLLTWGLSSGIGVDQRWSYLLKSEGEFSNSNRREVLGEVEQLALQWKSSHGFLSDRSSGKRSLRLSLGRSIQEWSILDSEWKLGIIEPRYRGDELSTLRVGLVGLFADAKLDGFQFLLFASPLMIPERGVPFSVQEGALVSKSAWFIGAPKEVLFLNQNTPVRYGTEVPATRELLFHASAGIKISRNFGSTAKLGVHWLNKPVQQLALSYDAVLGLSDLVAQVNLFPRILRHDVIGVDWRWQLDSTFLWAGHFFDRPYELNRPVLGATAQKFEPAQVSGLGVSQQFSSKYVKKTRARLGIAFLNVQKQRDQDIGSLAKASGESLFPDRYWMRQALQTNLDVHINRNWILDFSFLRDLKFPASMLRSSLSYVGFRDWTVRLRSDAIGSASVEGFLSPFQSNDRVSGEVQYVF